MSDAKFKVQDQVIMRRPILHGRGSQLIKVGTILAFSADGKKATVSFPADRTRLEVSLDQLEPVKNRFNRARVELSPIRRAIGFMQ